MNDVAIWVNSDTHQLSRFEAKISSFGQDTAFAMGIERKVQSFSMS